MSLVTSRPTPTNSTPSETDDIRHPFTFFQVVCLSVISFIGIVANIVIIRKLALRKMKSSEYFILNLAMTDLTVCALGIPLDVYEQLHTTWRYGAFLCKIIWPFQTVFTLVSILTLTAMAVERYRAIITPFKPRLKHSDLLKVIAGIWVIGICVIAPYINYLTYDGKFCKEKWPMVMSSSYYTLALFVIDYCIPLIIITYCYGRAGYKLHVNTKEFQAANARVSNHAQRARLERNTRVIKLFSFAVLVFLVCMLPGDCYWMWKAFDKNPYFKYEEQFKALSSTMIYANSCINPFIFGACNFSCFKSRSFPTWRRKLNVRRLASANSLSLVSNGKTGKMELSDYDETTQHINLSELAKLRETDI